MKAVGLITEYNPMHFGHIYHLKESMIKSNADVNVVVMSGNFVQRGEPAIIDKYTRAKAAINSGANLVVELPAYYALSSAEGFAFGAMCTLSALNCKSVVFGSECGNIDILYKIAKLMADEPKEYKLCLKEQLALGNSFPKAREYALKSYLDEDSLNILNNPNNILGIEYIKTIIKYNLNIKPLTISRIKSHYNETNINQDETIQSATAIREALSNNTQLSALKEKLPLSMYEELKCSYGATAPIYADDFSAILNYKLSEIFLRNNNDKELISTELTEYLDITPDIANRISVKYTGLHSFCEFASLLKSKSYTMSRIYRCLMHIILNIKNTDKTKFESSPNIPYIRILGFDKKGQEYLSYIKKTVETPIITKTAKYSALLKEDIYAANIYNQVCFTKFANNKELLKDEFRRGIYIKPE